MPRAAAGQYADAEEVVASVETDKVTIDVRTTEAGLLTKWHAEVGQTVTVGEPLYTLDTSAAKQDGGEAPAPPPPKAAEPAEDKVATPAAAQPQPPPPPPTSAAPPPPKSAAPPAPKPAADKPAEPKPPAAHGAPAGERETRVPMSRMRQRIAERLKGAQETCALLTTFNEVDMSALMALRAKHKDAFEKKHGGPRAPGAPVPRRCCSGFRWPTLAPGAGARRARGAQS